MQFCISGTTLYVLFWNMYFLYQSIICSRHFLIPIKSYFLILQAAVYSTGSMYHNLFHYLGFSWISTIITKPQWVFFGYTCFQLLIFFSWIHSCVWVLVIFMHIAKYPLEILCWFTFLPRGHKRSISWNCLQLWKLVTFLILVNWTKRWYFIDILFDYSLNPNKVKLIFWISSFCKFPVHFFSFLLPIHNI